MPRTLDKDTLICLSLSGRPSNIGTRFHNFLYDELDLNFVYKGSTTTDLPAAVAGIRALGIRGCGVSMPFKEDVIALVDVLHDSATAIGSVNTILNEDGVLHAYNTDYQAVADLVGADGFPRGGSAAVTGSGGMAKAVVAALRDSGFTDGTVVARNEPAGRALAEAYGYSWSPVPVGAPSSGQCDPDRHGRWTRRRRLAVRRSAWSRAPGRCSTWSPYRPRRRWSAPPAPPDSRW